MCVGYLVDLNTTGAFPDETDKTPMCFIRCYLNNVGILKEDELDRDKAIEMEWSTSDEALDECYQEVAGMICHFLFSNFVNLTNFVIFSPSQFCKPNLFTRISSFSAKFDLDQKLVKF